MAAGGFGLLVLDFGERTPFIPSATWLRLRRVAAAPGTVVLAVALRALPGLLGSASVTLQQARPQLASAGPAAPALLQGLSAETSILRNHNPGGDSRIGPTFDRRTSLHFRHAL